MATSSKIPSIPQAGRREADNQNLGPLASVQLAKDNAAPPAQDPAWVFVGSDIDGTRWNKSYPYQLLIVKKEGTGYSKPLYTFTLPIPPESFSISTPFAITGTVTQGGYVEEHNGAPVRNISFSGTTGVLPLRGTGEDLGRANALQGIFAGTISAANTTIDRANTLAGNPPHYHNLVSDDLKAEGLEKSSGYYQFRLLQRFMESYVAMKKGSEGAAYRLALAVWKDQAVYLVTPVTFEVRRSASSPWEYNYSLAFRAFRRVTINNVNPSAFTAFQSVTRDPNAFAQVVNKLGEARRVLQGLRDVLGAVVGDVDNLLFEPLRETMLFCKDAVGVSVAAADLPKNITRELKSAVLEAAALGGAFDRIGKTFDGKIAEAIADIRALSVKSGKAESGGGSAGAGVGDADPGNLPFERPEEFFELFEQINPSELNVPPATQRKIQEERERIRRLTRLDFERARDSFVQLAADFADSVGLGSETYNATFGRRSTVSSKVPTQDDFDALFALNATIMELNRLAASGDVGRETMTTVESLAGLAGASGIAFKVPTSKYAVPFPYGATLEQLAAQYLGDSNRWIEIAALNGLRQPYVDEEGFISYLLTNGRGNQVTVSDASNFYVGQPVWLSGANTSRSKRRITKIERIAPGTVVLTLDGEPDLERFTTQGMGAAIQAFLPDTVNSQMLIYIPSDSAAEEDDFRTKSIPGVDEFDRLIQVGGTDLLLTQSGDLAVTPDGDCRLAIGLTNLIQRVRVALGTPKGSLLRHPDYGLGIRAGINTADLNPQEMLAALQDLFRADPSFTGVSALALSKAGPVVRVAMSLGIAGMNQTIPVSVDIKR